MLFFVGLKHQHSFTLHSKKGHVTGWTHCLDHMWHFLVHDN